MDHEIVKCVSSEHKDCKLDSKPNCRKCPQNKRLNHHQHLIPVSEFKRQDLAVWSNLKFCGKLTLDDCFDFIKLLIQLLRVRLEGEYVSEYKPTEIYIHNVNTEERHCGEVKMLVVAGLIT